MPRGDYTRSLKLPASEELLDLVLYRPVAFALVRAIARFPVTPNQVTMFSLAAGLAAAYAFATGSRAGMSWGALSYALANVLDCADGQLARLQKSGTLLGRVVDGAADYVSALAVFTGLGIGLASPGAAAWWTVLVAGISTGVQAMYFDYYQSEFISSAAGESDFIDREIDRFSAEIGKIRRGATGAIRIYLLRFYVGYLRVQKKFCSPGRPSGSQAPAGASMIRLWSFLGPTTNRTLLVVCALAGRLDAYLWLVAGAGNTWLIAACLLQSRLRRGMNPARSRAADGERS